MIKHAFFLFSILPFLASSQEGASDINWGRLKRESLAAARNGTLHDAEQIAAQLSILDDPSGALEIVFDCLDELEQACTSAIAERDAQGDKLFRFYCRYYESDGSTGKWKPSRMGEVYQEMKEESRLLNSAIRDAEHRLSTFASALTELAERSRVLPDRREAFVALLHVALGKRQKNLFKVTVLDSIPEGFEHEILKLLDEVAFDAENRPVRVAALRVLGRRPIPEAFSIASKGTVDGDPFVRRAANELLGRLGTVEAIDLLIERLAIETGICAEEIITHLSRLLGECFHQNVALWKDHWETMRNEWNGMPRGLAKYGQAASGFWRYHGLELYSTRVVFVLDISHSMERAVSFRPSVFGQSRYTTDRIKIDVAREELKRAINSLRDDASFNIIVYETKWRQFSGRVILATETNRQKAMQWIDRLEPSGNTNLSGPLIAALKLTEGQGTHSDVESADTILFLSDGKSTCGPIKYEEDVLDEVARLNRQHQVTVHTISLGFEDTTEFMEALAKQNGGRFVHIKK